MTRFTEAQLAQMQQRMAAQSKVYTHHIKDDEVREMEPRKNGRPKFEEEARQKRSRRQITDQSEAVVLKECSQLLERHPRIQLWWRVNVGAMKMDNGRYVKFSFVGCSDLLAMSTAGRFIAIETKKTGGKATEEQLAFLANVNTGGGLGVVVDHAGKLALALREL